MIAQELDAKTIRYGAVQEKLDHLVKKFYTAYGWRYVERMCGSYDDMRAEANQAFLEAFMTYRDDRGMKFRSWVGNKVWFRLLDILKRKTHQARLLKRTELDDYRYDFSPFSLSEFLESLSANAQEVVRIAVVETPYDVMVTLTQKRDDGPRAMQAAIREFLLDIGWTSRQVTETFLEIRKALND
jgi:hypothetical protein